MNLLFKKIQRSVRRFLTLVLRVHLSTIYLYYYVVVLCLRAIRHYAFAFKSMHCAHVYIILIKRSHI